MEELMAKPDIRVSIAILIHQNKVLVGWREADQHQGNKYEFPGGKVEAGESPINACRREVLEEVGLDLENYFKFDFIRHEYEDVIVSLNFYFAYVKAADLDKIKQPWTWYRRDELQDLNFPKANKPIIKRLNLLKKIKISEDILQLNQLEEGQYLYWRPESIDQASQLLAQMNPNFLSRLIVNIDVWKGLSELQQKMVKMVQLKHHQVMKMQISDLIQGISYFASCHDQESLWQAQRIGCEAAFLSPVQTTESHPEAEAMGWKTFANLAQKSDMAVYALGGLKSTDLATALQYYAHGIAGIRYM
jgi:8-oxo-dGTP diphosphatase